MRRLRTLPAVGAVCLSVLLGACGGSEEPEDQAASSPQPQSTPSASASPSASPSASATPAVSVDPAARGLSTITLGSIDAEGRPAEFGASKAALSGNGDFLAYQTLATAPTDKRSTAILLVRDLRNNTVVPACTSAEGEPANGGCESPSLSDDGQFVVFESTATNLVPEDTSPNADVYRKDLRSGAIVLVSSAAKNGGAYFSSAPSTSADGRVVAFVSEAPLDPAHPIAGPVPALPNPEGSALPDPRPARQIYVKNLDTGLTTLVSRNAAGKPGDDSSAGPKISADGTTVAFSTAADNIVGKGRQGTSQVLIAKTATGKVVGLEKLLRLRLPKFNFVLEYSTPTRFGGRIAYSVGIDTFDDDEDGSTEASTSSNEGVFVADLNRGTVVHTVRTATGSIDRQAGCAALSADGKHLAYCTFVKKTKALGSGYQAYVAEVDGNTLRLMSGPPRGTKDPDARPEAVAAGGAVVYRSANPQRGVDAEIAKNRQMFVARPAE